ncbi:MAG TPA: type II toxin-antitoxin system VapC family toxin [Bryobacteraceae bacterium]|nr:type II toxin-antitoxin system VapC family toxin [Bryobacteraceae bacterium]
MAQKAINGAEPLILDSSAILAALLGEPGYDAILERISNAPSVGVGAPTFVEAAIVLSSKLRRDARPHLNEFLREAAAEVIPWGPEHVDAALDAFLRYGKGRHPASLNFGGCLTYAVAAVAGVPLLSAGNDFIQTDLDRA